MKLAEALRAGLQQQVASDTRAHACKLPASLCRYFSREVHRNDYENWIKGWIAKNRKNNSRVKQLKK